MVEPGGLLSMESHRVGHDWSDLAAAAAAKGVRKYLTVVLTCISLTILEMEPLFMCLLAICICSLQKCLLKSFVHFWIGLFVFLLLSLGVLYIFWILISYQIYNWKIFCFAYSVDWLFSLFTLLTLSIDVQFLKFSWSLNYLFFPFWPMPFMLYPTNHCSVMKGCPD